jgi:hypothetical protein
MRVLVTGGTGLVRMAFFVKALIHDPVPYCDD